MAVQKVLETAKKFIQDAPDTTKPLHEVFFPQVDTSDSVDISIDDRFGVGFAVASISDYGVSERVQYIPGQGQKFIPHFYRRSTPIDEKMRDSVAVGLDAKSPAAMSYMRYVEQIVGGSYGFMQAARMTRNKMAMDVLLEGKMNYYDKDALVNYTYDFGRDAANFMTPDFDTETFDSAILEMYTQAKVKGMSTDNLAVVLGSSWYSLFETDSTVLAKRNARNTIQIQQDMLPPAYRGSSEVVVIGKYHVDGMVAPITLLAINSRWKYFSKKGASGADYMPAAKSMMIDMSQESWQFNRGIDVCDSAGNIVRGSGELILDGYKTSEPPAEFLRVNFRPFYYFGNPDNVIVSTGTNFVSSE